MDSGMTVSEIMTTTTTKPTRGATTFTKDEKKHETISMVLDLLVVDNKKSLSQDLRDFHRAMEFLDNLIEMRKIQQQEQS